MIGKQIRASLDKPSAQVQAMFDQVAPHYDLMNNLMAPGQVPAWRIETRRAIQPGQGDLILDLAAGTGSSAIPLMAAGAEVICCDLSFGMLTEGKQRHKQICAINADALHLPFADDTFDAVTISFGLRNVEDTLQALREMYRVTKPGGKVVVCEFSTPVWKPLRAVYRKFIDKALPAIAKVGSTNAAAYKYLAESINTWPNQVTLAQMMREAGWTRLEWKNLTAGIVALHRGYK